jgi:hypothetical protein
MLEVTGDLPFHIHIGNQELGWVRIGLTGLGELDMARHGGGS